MSLLERVRVTISAGITFVVCAVCSANGFADAACSKPWPYNVPAIQEARRLIKSPRAFTAISPRVACARSIIGSLDAFVDQECTGCAPEYCGLLSDSAVYMRKAYDELRESRYVEMEVGTRTKLHNFLLEERQEEIRRNYFGGNLAALADSMERKGQAKAFHSLMSELDGSLISNIGKEKKARVMFLWVKAVRSCPKWDFNPVADSLDALKAALCAKNCKDSFDEVYAQLERAGLLRSNGTVRPSMPSLPTPAECQAPL